MLDAIKETSSHPTITDGIGNVPVGHEDGYDIRFIGEGAANVVVEVLQNGENAFPGNLLRVPKAGTTAHPYTELQSYWETSIRPFFQKDDLVQQSLLPLKDNTITNQLNTYLSTIEPSRRADFRGSRVADTDQGMLVEDMRQRHPDDLILEFKPKWLAQSPSAPSGSTRCRNCARTAQQARKKGSSGPMSTPCSLKLLGSQDALAEAAGSLVPTASPQRDRLTAWLGSDNVLKRLRNLQVELDRDGPLQADTGDERFQLAMTLRDCTCFVRIPGDGTRPVEARLGDLDRKNAEGKMDYWRETERVLVDGGFYEGTEEGGGVVLNCGL